MKTPYPDYDDVMNECLEIAESSSELVTHSVIGQSEEGRDMPLLTVTDHNIPAQDKSVFLLSGGTDGDEEVGRVVCLAMVRELLKPENRSHLEKQTVLIVPVTNPDGCVRDQQDKAGNANGVRASEVHKTNEPATAEGRAMRALVDEWIPDCHIDFHGLAGGGMGDSMYLYPTVNEKWSYPTLFDVARKMSEAGEAAGFPQDGRPRLWVERRTNLPGWLARNHSCFCMVLEATENYYPIEDSVAASIPRLKRLMEIGETTDYFQIHPNYPCDVVSGGRMGAILPFGNNYAERRKCRRDISQMIIEGVPVFGRQACDHDWTAVIHLPVEDSVRTFPQGMTFKATIDKRATIKEVLWHDHVLESELWKQEMTKAGIVVTAYVPEKPVCGNNDLRITYEVPFKRHVDKKID